VRFAGKRRAIPAAALLGRGVLRLLWASVRQQPVSSIAQSRLAQAVPGILVLWHEEILLASTFVTRILKTRTLAILASRSDDGELVTRVGRPFGLHIARGSASRGGREGLRALYKALSKSGASPLLMPDGPRGPAHVVKPGAVVLAQMTGVPILPLHFAADRVWTVRSWDRMAVPKPLCRIRLRVGEPLSVPRQLSTQQVETWCATVSERLDELRHQPDT
jgi:lysophospholipid acyltransferase (LPLAT)-like uncharacterized protein